MEDRRFGLTIGRDNTELRRVDSFPRRSLAFGAIVGTTTKIHLARIAVRCVYLDEN
jgi:hypothetical protein